MAMVTPQLSPGVADTYQGIDDARAAVNSLQAALGVGNSLCREALHSNTKHPSSLFH